MDKLHGQSGNTMTECIIEKTSGEVMQSEVANFKGGLVVATDTFFR